FGSQIVDFGRGIGVALLQTFAYYLFFLVIERFVPAERDQPYSAIRFNLLYLPFYLVGTALLLPVTTALVVGQLKSHFPQMFDLTRAYSAGLAFVLSFWGFYIHTNLNLHFGVVNRMLCTPQLHRLHHSIRVEHHDCNFAAIFPIYDVIFGTYRSPVKGDVPE